MPTETEKAIERVRHNVERCLYVGVEDTKELLAEHDRLKAENERLTTALAHTRANMDRLTYYNPEEDQLNVDLMVEEIKLALRPLPTPRTKEEDLLPAATAEQLAAKFDAWCRPLTPEEQEADNEPQE
jgi:hypothetical protein